MWEGIARSKVPPDGLSEPEPGREESDEDAVPESWLCAHTLSWRGREGRYGERGEVNTGGERGKETQGRERR